MSDDRIGCMLEFTNDYALSLQRSEAHKSTEHTWEIAVMHHGRVCSLNAITREWSDSILGYQPAMEVLYWANRVMRLTPSGLCSHTKRQEDHDPS